MEISKLTLISSNLVKSQPSNDLIGSAGKTFSEVLQGLGESQKKSDDLMARLAAGEDIDIHTVMLAVEENEVNFKVAMAIRNKLVDAYRDIIRMPV